MTDTSLKLQHENGRIDVHGDLEGEGADAQPVAILYTETLYDTSVSDLMPNLLPGFDFEEVEGDANVFYRVSGNVKLNADEVRILVGKLLEAIQPLTEEERQREIARAVERAASQSSGTLAEEGGITT